ncbi:MAG: hypothetical protein WDO13_05290 [Verrucomicrobiota bacterium]
MNLFDIIGLALAGIVALFFVGGLILLIATEVSRELKAMAELDELNERKQKEKHSKVQGAGPK